METPTFWLAVATQTVEHTLSVRSTVLMTALQFVMRIRQEAQAQSVLALSSLVALMALVVELASFVKVPTMTSKEMGTTLTSWLQSACSTMLETLLRPHPLR